MSTLILQGTLFDYPAANIDRGIDQRIACSPDPSERVISLLSDGAKLIDLDGLAKINAIQIETDNKITAIITSTDGTSQAVPVDPYACIISRSVAITAISLLRVAGQDTTVRLVLGQGA